MSRLSHLDYLRGLTALGIMLYHYSRYTFGSVYTSEDLMARIGLYGVSIFYILSGLTLYHVYESRFTPNLQETYSFLKRRAFRIFPLLWLATFLSVLLKGRIDTEMLLLNLSGLFGFIDWDSYYAIGAWSIGNELVFYTFFPFFFYMLRKSGWGMLLFTVLIFGVYLFFAFNIVDLSESRQEQWQDYTNPLNQLFLFLGGFLLAHFFKEKSLPTVPSMLLLLLALGVFVSYPVHNSNMALVVGVPRLIFTLMAFLICLSFYKLSFKFPPFIDKPLAYLGEASYSIYLLHPVVYFVLKSLLFTPQHGLRSPLAQMLICTMVTFAVSALVYQFYEKPFMNLGRGTSKLTTTQARSVVAHADGKSS